MGRLFGSGLVEVPALMDGQRIYAVTSCYVLDALKAACTLRHAQQRRRVSPLLGAEDRVNRLARVIDRRSSCRTPYPTPRALRSRRGWATAILNGLTSRTIAASSASPDAFRYGWTTLSGTSGESKCGSFVDDGHDRVTGRSRCLSMPGQTAA